MKKIIFIGRKDHLAHITVRKFLDLSKKRDSDVIFLTKKQFLETDLADISLVCLKSASAYFDDKVWTKINNQPSNRSVNKYKPTQICLNRKKINFSLEEISIPIPFTAYNKEDFYKLKNKVIVKSIFSNKHDIKTHRSNKQILNPNFEKKIYQEFIQNDGFDYKYYGVGNQIFALRKKASEFKHHKEKINEKRIIIKPNPDLVSMLIKLRDYLDLDIYGVDFIKSNDGKYYAIDLNLFPGLIGIPNAPAVWLDYLLSLLDN